MDIVNWLNGFSGKTGFIPEYIAIHRFSTKFKIRFFFHLKPNHKVYIVPIYIVPKTWRNKGTKTRCLGHECDQQCCHNSSCHNSSCAVLKREYRRLFKIVNLEFSVRCRFSFARYTAISIKVVPKKREKVEYERERLIGKD